MLTNPTVPPSVQGSRLFVKVADGTGSGNIFPKVVDLGEVGVVAGEWHALVIWHKRSSAYLFNKDQLEASLLPTDVLAPFYLDMCCFRITCYVLVFNTFSVAVKARFTRKYAPREQYHQLSIHQPSKEHLSAQGPPMEQKLRVTTLFDQSEPLKARKYGDLALITF